MMDIFKKKKGSSENEYLPENLELNLGDISSEFSSVREGNKLFFGRFHKDEIQDLLEESGIWTTLARRGYVGCNLEINILSYLDNRIYIKTNKGDVLVHIRLKADDFYFKTINQSLKLIYIDWLLTQNINYNKNKPKGLFEGQEYPGLNIFKEITFFIRMLSERLGAHGVYNIPEYFHDAVLFHKYFKFLVPEIEGEFLSLLKFFGKRNVRKLSDDVHSGNIIYAESKEIYQWKHSEMIYSDLDYMQNQIFNDSYSKIVREHSDIKFLWKDN